MPHDDGQVVMTVSGRSLDVLTDGPPGGSALVFHSGTPSAALPFRPLSEAVAAHGLRLVTWSRPGYGASDPAPGRSVADAASDTAAVLDALGIDDFLTLGWSGGGPHALACAALLPGRCRAAATIAGIAPYPAEGLDWLAGMAAENVEEFSLALQGEQALTAYLEEQAPVLRQVTGADVAESLGGLISAVDRASLTGEFADYLAAALRGAVSRGVSGWREDDLAFTRNWGFRVCDIGRPVAVWQGDQDLMVPPAHGRWLVERLPDVRDHLLPGEGHLSLTVGGLDRIVADLVDLGRPLS
ncbi:MAG: alpha/beta hydrolase [Blastococcus sp.]|nr:alpha/beta hydrolase [Blastococcus sp.]